MTSEAKEEVKVTKADRERSADLYLAEDGDPLSPYSQAVAADVRKGENDHWKMAQAFARHREEAEKRIVDWLREVDGQRPTDNFCAWIARRIERADHHSGEQ